MNIFSEDDGQMGDLQFCILLNRSCNGTLFKLKIFASRARLKLGAAR